VIVLFDDDEAVESVLGHQPAYIVDVLSALAVTRSLVAISSTLTE